MREDDATDPSGEELLIHYGAQYWRFYDTAADRGRRWIRKRGPLDHPVEAEIAALSALTDTLLDAAMTEMTLDAAVADPAYQLLVATPPADMIMHNGLLWDAAGRLLVPQGEALRTRILSQCHDSLTGAHFARDKTNQAVQARFRWPGLSTDSDLYVATCESCQRNKPSQQLTPGALMPLPIPERPCQEWTTDAVTGLPKTLRGHDCIQVYIERLCKVKRFAAARKSDDAVAMARSLVHHVIRPHGVPERIISDRDPRFTAHFYAELSKLLGITLALSTARHPQSDGQSEREIKTLIIALRAYCNDHADDWDEHLDMLELGFNSAVQSSTGRSPYEMLYGAAPRLPIDVALSTMAPRNPAAIDRATRMRNALTFARGRLRKAQDAQVRNASRRVAAHAVGDQVLLSTAGLQIAAHVGKLSAIWIGPFTVTAVVNANAYTLALPVQLSALHPTFNIDKLKPFRTTHAFASRPVPHARPPPAITADSNGDEQWEVDHILAQRYTGPRMQYLVRWKGYPLDESTWEPKGNLTDAAGAISEWELRLRD